ncbi:hypothetical protein T12_6488 [Trichinella patagoniensis]|uniref:Uncharacterized protein n=1 Tax=Trichinella patagoniensis TaxID=990121 RepID=A0A0V1A537_9BILA|nr:hypothetical protein T12_6488 [Trichinella patagoniensis]
MRASYNVSLLIAKTRKAHTVSEKLILLAVNVVLHTVPSTSELILPAEEFSDIEEDILEIKDAPELSPDY